MRPFFSIIVPTKNRREMLEKCIDSILNQTFIDFELIAVNDHSTDDTLEFLQTINDNRLQVILSSGTERSAALNSGLDISEGRYICFVADDDYISARFLQDFYDAIEENQFDGCFIPRCMLQYVYEDGKAPKNCEVYSKDKYKSFAHFIAFEFCGIVTLAIPYAIAKNGRFHEKFPHWQDSHYLFQIFDKKLHIEQIYGVNYFYRIYPTSGKRLEITSEELLAKAEINVEAIKDAFLSSLPVVKMLPKNSMNKLVSEKYMEYAVRMLIVKGNNKLKLAFKLVLKSMVYGVFFRNWKHYGMFVKKLFKW